MKIKDLKENSVASVENVKVTEVAPVRTFHKFGKEGRVASASIEDDSGKCTLTLWNEDIDLVKKDQTLNIIDGYVRSWQGNLQISKGKSGKIEVVDQ